jgi:hypothetical protein
MHKILVLCQRKYDEYGNDIVNSDINHLVYRLFGIYCDIKYVCNLRMNGFVDYDGYFGDNEWTRSNFIPNSYSMIILNTSPLPLIQHNIFKNYLNKDGIIAVTIYTPNRKIINIEDELGNNMNQKILDHLPEFERLTFLDIPDALLYTLKCYNC